MPAAAISITGYSSAVNDRFSSGFPSAPIPNSDPSFVGDGLNWNGIAWSLNTHDSGSYKGLGMLSPRHFLTAQHYEYSNISGSGQNTKGIRLLGLDGQVYQADARLPSDIGPGAITAVDNLGYGIELTPINEETAKDLAIGTLKTAVTSPNNMARLPLLDLNPSSSTNQISNYNLDLFLYGRSSTTNGSPRIVATTASGTFNNGGDSTQPVIATAQSDATFQTGDSGAPALHQWTTPNGQDILTVVGMNSAVDSNANYLSLFPVAGAISAAQSVMASEGFTLAIEGNPSQTWDGSSNTSISDDASWGVTGKPQNVSDIYVLFDASSAANRSVNIDSNHNLRGLYFKTSGIASDPFTFSGAQTLTLGRGGLTNYDDDAQVFSANIALGTSQYWNVGTGGVQLTNLDTNGHLLEIDGNGSSSISGIISDTGGIALSAGQLTLSSSSTYTGNTWIHGGELIVHGDISSSAEVIIDSYGTLSGSGSVPVISGSGLIAPGSSPGILTSTAISPSAGLDFAFEFTAASAPDFDLPTNSINDLIRLTDASPFTVPLDSSNTLSIYLNVASVEEAQQYRGGFFTDTDADFLASLSGANIEFYIADPSGSVSYNGQTYSEYSGIFLFSLSTPSQSADFGTGTVNGRILQIEAVPDQSQYAGWQVFHTLTGTDAENDADTDFDGIGQLLEFAFGGDPHVNDINILPTKQLTEQSGSTYLELSMTRPIGLQGITYTPQTTTDLTSWPSDSTGIADDNPTPTDNGNGTETLVYRRSQPVSGADKAFIRVEVIENP